jgi:hypothetical protein
LLKKIIKESWASLLTLIIPASRPKKPFLFGIKISSGYLKQTIFFKQKCLANIITNFFVSAVCNTNVIFNVLLMIMYVSATHVFIKQIFRAAEKAPLSPSSPHRAVHGMG